MNYRRGLTAIQPADPHEFLCRATAVMLLVFGSQSDLLGGFYHLVGAALLLYPPLIRRPSIWWMLIAVTALLHGTRWYRTDNHRYLQLYWLIACALSARAADPMEVLRRNARGLVGLCFCCSLFAKLIWGHLWDGDFIHWALMFDQRFEPVAMFATDLGPHWFARVRNLPLQALVGVDPSAPVPIPGAEQLRDTAVALSWWTLGLEAVIAAGFLIPRRFRRTQVTGHAALLLFIVTTYAILPVHSFGYLLAVLGLASSLELGPNLPRLHICGGAFMLTASLVPKVGDYFVRVLELLGLH